MSYLQNTLLVGDYYKRTTMDYDSIFQVEDYSSMNILKIKEYINNCPPEWFTYTKAFENDTPERIAYSLYGNANYWDVVMLVNDADPFTLVPRNYDTLYKIAQNKVKKYETEVYGKSLDDKSYHRLVDKYISELQEKNEDKYRIKVIKSVYIQTFLQVGFEEGVF